MCLFPLGGSRHGIARTAFALTVTMGLGGLWHGAAWTFVIWGLFHGLLLAGERALGLVPAKGQIMPLPIRAIRILVMFHLACFAWVLFRAPDIESAWTILVKLVVWEDGPIIGRRVIVLTVFCAILHLSAELWPRIREWQPGPIVQGALAATNRLCINHPGSGVRAFSLFSVLAHEYIDEKRNLQSSTIRGSPRYFLHKLFPYRRSIDKHDTNSANFSRTHPSICKASFFSNPIPHLTVVFLGSSRTAFGINPETVDPVLSEAWTMPIKSFNYGLGCGNALTYRFVVNRLTNSSIAPIVAVYGISPTDVRNEDIDIFVKDVATGATPIKSLGLYNDLSENLAQKGTTPVSNDSRQKQVDTMAATMDMYARRTSPHSGRILLPQKRLA